MIGAALGLPIGDDFSVRKKTATDVGVGREAVESGVGGVVGKKEPPKGDRLAGWVVEVKPVITLLRVSSQQIVRTHLHDGFFFN